MTDDAPLLAALEGIRDRGAIGERSLVDAVAHAEHFVSLIPAGAGSVVDLGSGGGLPALVIAWRRDDLHVTMVERRGARADLLRRAVRALGLGGRAVVAEVDVATLCRDAPSSFDVATARSFATVSVVANAVATLLRAGGSGLVSEPPSDRTAVWATVLSVHRELEDHGVARGIRQLVKTSVQQLASETRECAQRPSSFT